MKRNLLITARRLESLCVRWTPHSGRTCWKIFRLVAFTGVLAVATPVRSQSIAEATKQVSLAVTGVVVSSTRNTLVVRSENGTQHLYIYDRHSVRPKTLSAGTPVRVVSVPSDEIGVRVATDVAVVGTGPEAAQREGTPDSQVVPFEVRRIEREIERQTRRYQAGVRTGLALDPELVLVGVHAQVGPFFNPDVHLRPNVEFAFGEVTALFALNLEAIYRLPVSSREGRWSTYFGIGPAFSFLHQDFSRTNGRGRSIDFDDFNTDVGLNILGGLRFRSGKFLELKTSAYSRPAPSLRLIVGYNF